ncbi:MAG TPA: peptidogalycan biosysnthesis protein, partial [Aquabacterium sp.]|nr:peptidogalycan biosysnthesis protein [Aquabacterium sp.]
MDRIHNTSAAAQVSMVAGLSAQWHTCLDEIPADEWDRLVDGAPGGSPFMRHACLTAMVDSGSACPETGWHPLFLTLRDPAGQLVGACPGFAKTHSYGEYVFDWAWADAHDRALAAQGQHYYPKLLVALPFSPIPGQRLLVEAGCTPAIQTEVRRRLLAELQTQCRHQGWSSAHVLFLSDAEAELAEGEGWLHRNGVQFHWENRLPQPYRDFADFLASLQRDKRKKI